MNIVYCATLIFTVSYNSEESSDSSLLVVYLFVCWVVCSRVCPDNSTSRTTKPARSKVCKRTQSTSSCSTRNTYDPTNRYKAISLTLHTHIVHVAL